MHVTTTPFPGVLILQPNRFLDVRGFFSETYNRRRATEAGIFVEFVQDNLAYSKTRYTLRGLHFQREPFAQAKLVGVVRGSVLDVIVDLRRTSPCFGCPFTVELSAAEGNQLFVPVGFAHGFLTLEAETLFTYKVSNHYSPEHEGGIRFDDPLLAISWGAEANLIVTSNKDRELPSFDPKTEYFA